MIREEETPFPSRPRGRRGSVPFPRCAGDSVEGLMSNVLENTIMVDTKMGLEVFLQTGTHSSFIRVHMRTNQNGEGRADE